MFLVLKQPAKCMGLKDFSLLKARFCQYQCTHTHTFQPTLTLLLIRTKTPFPFTLFLFSYAKSTKPQSRSKSHSHLLMGMLLTGAFHRPFFRQLSDYLSWSSSATLLCASWVLDCVPPETAPFPPCPRNCLLDLKLRQYPGWSLLAFQAKHILLRAPRSQ